MANTIKIKAGSGVPTTSDIVDKELAFDRSGNKLYINDSGTIVNLSGAQGGGASDTTGAVTFTAQAGEALSKGDVVYISGLSGNTPIVSKADADDSNKMPAFGLAAETASLNNSVEVVTFGILENFDTSSFTQGTVVYVSTTAGSLASSAPTGESSLIQNIGYIVRSHASTGAVKIGGAGRTNATPNLNQNKIFLGNASNQAEATALSSIGLSSFNNDSGFTTNVGDITGVTAGSGLSGGGTSGSVTLSHADTSSQASVDNSGRTYIQDITLDTYGHVTGITSATETVTDTTYSAGSGIDLTGTTFSHTDTSSASNLTASSRTYVTALTFDTYGHVTGYSTGTETVTDTNTTYSASTGLSLTGTAFSINFKDEDDMLSNSALHAATQQSIKAYVDTKVAAVVDSAPAALDTLNELAAALGDDANFSTTTSTALGNRLRVDTAAQGLTGTQQANAITNLGITATKAELNYVDGVTSNIQTQLDGKLTSSSGLNASNLTSGTINNARLNTDMQLTSAAPRYRLQESDVTNTPNWWMIADGGNLSFRLNNTGTYPLVFQTNATNDAVTGINLGYSTAITGTLEINNRITSTGTEGFTIGNYAGYDRIANDLNTFKFVTDGNGYANMAFGTVTTGTWGGSVIASAYLDADTAHLSGTQTFTGAKTFSSDIISNGIEVGTAYGADAQYLGIKRSAASANDYIIIQGSGSDAGSTYITAGSGKNVNIRPDSNSTTNQLVVSSSGTTIGGNTVWHAGNDGSTSGLDADLLDGHHASAFLGVSAKAADSELLDGIDSSAFLRSNVADTIGAQLTMGTQTSLVASNYGHGVFGVYHATKYQHVWSMGTAYKGPADGTSTGTIGNLYGLAWSYNPDYGAAGNNAQSKTGLDHQLLLAMNGVTKTALGNGMWTSGHITLGTNNYALYGIDTSSQVRNLIRVDGSNNILLGDANLSGQTHLYPTTYAQINTNSGYVQIGPQNTSWNHIQTDRPGNYFDKKVIVDTGVIGSYNEDLQLQRANSTDDMISIEASAQNFIIDATTRMRLTSSGLDVLNNIYFGTGNIWQLDQGSWTGGSANQANMMLSGAAGTFGFHSNTSTVDILCDGNIRAYADVVAYYSDIRLKEKFEPITNAIEKVESLDTFTYESNDLAKKYGYGDEYDKLIGKRKVGVSAQQVQEVLPEAVALAPFDSVKNEDGTVSSKSGENYLTVKYEKLVPLLIQAIKEQQQQINELKEQLNG